MRVASLAPALVLAASCGAPSTPPPAAPVAPAIGEAPLAPSPPPLEGSAPMELVWQGGPRGLLRAAALDETGRLLAVASDDLTTLHDVETGAVRGHGPGARSVEICGRGLVVLRPDRSEVRLWDLATGELLVPPADGSLALSRSCREAAAIDLEGSAIVVWDIATRAVRASIALPIDLRQYTGPASVALAWSPAGDRIVATLQQPPPPPTAPRRGRATPGTKLWIFDATSGALVHELGLDVARGRALTPVWIEDGLFLDEGPEALRIDDTRGAAGERLSAAELEALRPPAPPRTARVDDGHAEVRELGRDAPLLRVSRDAACVPRRVLELLPDGSGLVLRGTDDGEVWSAAGVRPLQCFDAPGGPSEGGLVGCDEEARREPWIVRARGALWNGATRLERSEGAALDHGSPGSPDGAHAAAMVRRELRVWSLATGALVRSVPDVGAKLDWSPSGRHLVIARGDGTPVVLDPTGERADVVLAGARGATRVDRFSDDESVIVLLAPGPERSARVLHFDLTSGASLGSFEVDGTRSRWLVGRRAHVVVGPTTQVIDLERGEPIASAELPSTPIPSADGLTIVTCSAERTLEVRDGLTLELRRALDASCDPQRSGVRLSRDGRLALHGARVHRTADGAWIEPSAYADAHGVHVLARGSSGAIWTPARDLDRFVVREPGHLASARLIAGPDLTRFVAPDLLDAFFSGRPLPGPASAPRELPPDAPSLAGPPRVHPTWPGPDQRFARADEVELAWEPDLPGTTARVCRDAACTTVIAERVARGRGIPADTADGALHWSVIPPGGEPTAARRFWLGASGPLFGETLREPPSTRGPPLSAEVQVRFVPGGPTWIAEVVSCEPFLDPREGDEGCGMLVLTHDGERRYVVIDGGNALHETQLARVARPDGGAALLIVEARAFWHHEDTWHVHLVEDDGSGPRLALRYVLASCGGDDRGFGCGVMRARARYGDFDRDGDLDVEIERRRFLRDGDHFVRPPGVDEHTEAPTYGFPDSGHPPEDEENEESEE